MKGKLFEVRSVIGAKSLTALQGMSLQSIGLVENCVLILHDLSS
jgi:hypothetical protein